MLVPATQAWSQMSLMSQMSQGSVTALQAEVDKFHEVESTIQAG